jgi:hypothetical protein
VREEELVRELWRLSTLPRDWRCIDEERLAGFVEGRLTENDRRRVQRHLAHCDTCLHQAATLMQLEDSVTPDVPAALLARAREMVSTKSARGMRLAPRWIAVSAAIATVALAAGLWLNRPAQRTDAQPMAVAKDTSEQRPAEADAPPPQTMAAARPAGGADAPVVRSRSHAGLAPDLLYPRENAVLERTQLEFRWRKIPSSLYYEVRIVTESGDLVWEGRSNANRMRPPPHIHFAPGARYFVRIQAHLPEGRTVSTPSSAFRLKPKD